MSQVSKKPVNLPVRKRLKPTVNLNVACRRRKDAKDGNTSAGVTAEVQNKIESENQDSKVKTPEDNGSPPVTSDETKDSNVNVSVKENENILNTSFDSRVSVSSSVTTILLERDARTDHCTSNKNLDNTLNESFESQDGLCKSITSSVSTVLLHNDKHNNTFEKMHEKIVDQSLDSEEGLNELNISDAIVENNTENISLSFGRGGHAHDKLHVRQDESAKSSNSNVSQKNPPSRNKASKQGRNYDTLLNDDESESRKSVASSISAVTEKGQHTDSESVNNDDQSSISEYSFRDESDLSLPKYKRKISSMSKRLSEAKRSFVARYIDKKPERSSLRMLDLIYYNPSTNPMKSTPEKPNEIVVNLPSEEMDSSQRTEEDVDNPAEEEEEGMEDEDHNSGIPAPRVKVGPNGEIILDEQSLVIETTESKKSREEIANLTVVVDTGSSTTYHTYSKKKRMRTDWNVKETIRFYKALQTLGTDFSLMQTLFPTRSRLDLKSKFKKEEKVNGDLIEKALRFPSLFDISELEKDQANEENKETRKEKRRALQKKPRKRSLKSLGFDEEDNGPALKKKKRGKVKTLSQRNRDNDIRKETVERDLQSSSDEEYQLPAGEQRELSEGSNETTERRSTRITRGINGNPPNYATLENKHDFLEAGVDLLESSEAEEGSEPQEDNENAPVMPSNLSMSNVQPGSLVIVTAQCPNNPGYQICNVFMVQERSDSDNVSPSPTSESFSTSYSVPDSSTMNNESVSKLS